MRKLLAGILCASMVFSFVPTTVYANEDVVVEEQETVAVTEITLNAPESIIVGDTCDVEAVVTPEEATDKTLTWKSSDEAVASVDENGKVTGLSAGTVTITAESKEGVTGECVIAVEEADVQAESVSLNKTSITVTQGYTYTLKASVAPENTTDKSVTFTSSSRSVATVSENGVVKGIKPGTATITAKTENGKTAKCKVVVRLSKVSASVSNVSTTSCKVSWKKVANASGYKVYRATSENGTYSLRKTISGNSTFSYTNTGLKPGRTYYYKVRAYGKSSAYNGSYSSVVSYKAVPKSPTLSSSVSVTSSSVKLSWNKVSDATGYRIYKRSSTSSSWTTVATVSGSSTTSYKYTKTSGRYYYSVKSYRTINGVRYYSDRSSARRARVLSTPKITGLKNYSEEDAYRATVKWSAVTGASKYQVYVKEGENGTYKRVATVSGTSYTYKAPSHAVYYYYKIRAIYQYDGTTSYGLYSSAKEIKLYHYPTLMYDVSPYTENSTNVFAIYIQNTGHRTLRIYSRNARLKDDRSSTYNRKLYLCDTNAYESNGKLVKKSYVDIKPGAEAILLFTCDKNTRYNSSSKFYLEMRYEGQYYNAYFSGEKGAGYTSK